MPLNISHPYFRVPLFNLVLYRNKYLLSEVGLKGCGGVLEEPRRDQTGNKRRIFILSDPNLGPTLGGL